MAAEQGRQRTPFPLEKPSEKTLGVARQLDALITETGRIYIAPNQLRKGDLTKHWEVKDEPHVSGNSYFVLTQKYTYSNFNRPKTGASWTQRMPNSYRSWKLAKSAEKIIEVLYLVPRRSKWVS